jgi:hypothetical protein
MLDFDILTTTRAWVATPWDYNSCIGLSFRTTGSSDMVFGYGQTIYAKINFRFSVNAPNELELIYQDSPAGEHFVQSFTPSESQRSKTIQYSLKEGQVNGVAANSGAFRYYWTLSLDESPFPDELTLPHTLAPGDLSPPRRYYGHNQNERADRGGRPG